MPNNIALAKKYTPLIDEKYKKGDLFADLTSDMSLTRQGANAKEILYRQVSIEGGLGNYSRNSGYTSSNVKVEWKTATFEYDRGTKFELDVMDNEETMGDTYLVAQRELQDQKVIPEGNAYVASKLAGTDGITISVEAGESFADGEEFLKALLRDTTKMDEDSVPEEGRILYATPTLVNSIMALDTTKSREVIGRFSKIVKVPQSRFYTKIKLKDGTSSGEELGHFEKAEDGKDINYMIIDKNAVMKFDKHIVNDAIAPENNPNADAYIAKYRKYGLVDVWANKTAGIVLSHKAN
jgi:hypothetical protein